MFRLAVESHGVISLLVLSVDLETFSIKYIWIWNKKINIQLHHKAELSSVKSFFGSFFKSQKKLKVPKV